MIATVGLREDHRELTRRRVLGAVLDLLAEGSLDELSVPAVARRSGVSIATIYRYFPTRDDLVVAAAAEPARQALAAAPDRRASDDELAAFQRTMWHDFAKNMDLLRHQVTSTAGREMRRTRLDESRRQLATYVTGQGIDPTTPEGERVIALLLLVSGSLALVELHDRQGLEVEDAVGVSLWAVRTLIDASKPKSKPKSKPSSRPRRAR
jgi:AcrR family transcriptional regulator